MHVHIQNRPSDNFLPLMPQAVQQAMAGSGHRCTVSDDDAGFAAAALTMDILVSTADQIVKRFPCPAPRLKAAFLKHVGVDGLTTNNPLPGHVMLLNNSGAHDRKAGEYVLMAALMLQNGLPLYISQQRARFWQPRYSGTLSGKRVTILGVGGLGSAAARALHAHGVHLTGIRNRDEPHRDFDRVLPASGLDLALAETDILVLAAPLTPATSQILDGRRLSLLPQHAGVINIARGELVDEAALLVALRNGTISGAVLDVTTTEPLPPDDALWAAPNLVITPHVSATDAGTYAQETLRILLANLDDMADGRTPRNLVDLGRGY